VLDRRQLSWALVEEGVHHVALPVGGRAIDNLRLLEGILSLLKLDVALVLKNGIDIAVHCSSCQVSLNKGIEKSVGRTHEEVGLGKHYGLRAVHSQV